MITGDTPHCRQVCSAAAGVFHVLVVPGLLLVFSQLLLEFLDGPVNTTPQLGRNLVAHHFMHMLALGHDFDGRQRLMLKVHRDIEGGDFVEIPQQAGNLRRNLRLGGWAEVAMTGRNVDLQNDDPLRACNVAARTSAWAADKRRASSISPSVRAGQLPGF